MSWENVCWCLNQPCVRVPEAWSWLFSNITSGVLGVLPGSVSEEEATVKYIVVKLVKMQAVLKGKKVATEQRSSPIASPTLPQSLRQTRPLLQLNSKLKALGGMAMHVATVTGAAATNHPGPLDHSALHEESKKHWLYATFEGESQYL